MKKRTAIAAVIFFLVQAIPIISPAPAENLPLNPITEIKVGGSNLPFKETCNFLCIALSLYRSDAFEKKAKEELARIYNPMLSGSDLRFDFDRLDMWKKGWTRYYPFSVGEKRFIARIFLTKESVFQAKVPVLSELVVENLGVTLQVLPGINEILQDRSIKPNSIYLPFQADKSA